MFPKDSEAFEIVSQEVEKYRSLFENNGLKYAGSHVEQNELVKPSLKFKFIQLSNSYLFKIDFYVAKRKNGAMFSAYIKKPNGFHISVLDYLRVHGVSDKAVLFNCTYEVPDFRKYVDTFLEAIYELLQGELKPFIDGTKWEDVPFDWGPYK